MGREGRGDPRTDGCPAGEALSGDDPEVREDGDRELTLGEQIKQLELSSLHGVEDLRKAMMRVSVFLGLMKVWVGDIDQRVAQCDMCGKPWSESGKKLIECIDQMRSGIESAVEPGVHVVARDTCGFGGHERLTCVTCDKTLVHQPYMTSDKWEIEAKTFLLEHPGEVRDLGGG